MRKQKRIVRNYKFSEPRLDDNLLDLVVMGSSRPDRVLALHKAFTPSPVSLRLETNKQLPIQLSRFLGANCPWASQFRSSRGYDPQSANQSQLLSGFWINSVFLDPAWNRNYFHWHRNFLTHLAFLLSKGFSDISVVVEDVLAPFKLESLGALGIREENLVPISSALGRRVENWVSVEGLDRQKAKPRRDFVRPWALRELGRGLAAGLGVGARPRDLNIFVKRGAVDDRRIMNEGAVEKFLENEGGYIAIDLASLAYREQADLFNGAKNVVGMHGGGLTNLIFAHGPQVLEIAPSGHQWRPDFYPFSNSSGGTLTQVGLPSRNQTNDVEVPIDLLRWWLRANPAQKNFFISPDYVESNYGKQPTSSIS